VVKVEMISLMFGIVFSRLVFGVCGEEKWVRLKSGHDRRFED
jgi:hypothetical protein